MAEPEIRARLRQWVLDANPDIDPETLDGSTLLIEKRLLTSLQLPEMLLLLEELRGRPIDPSRLRPGVFRTLDAVYSQLYLDPAP